MLQGESNLDLHLVCILVKICQTPIRLTGELHKKWNRSTI